MAERSIIDARGHRCPVPTLRLRKALEAAASGSTLTLLADDPMAAVDVPHFVSEAGHRLASSSRDDAWLTFVVEKRG